MKQVRIALLVLFLAGALSCSRRLSDQETIFAAWNSPARIGGSVRAELQAHPNHEAVSDGMYLYKNSGPNAEQRTVRLQGEGDTIFWIQIEDRPHAADPVAEHQRYENEVDRLTDLLGEPRKKGNRLSATRQAHWTDHPSLWVDLRLSVSTEPAYASRILSVRRKTDQ
ncbi:MAG TPA: hypothetical protein PKW95_01115 [bacterium]|nr:hypothetical protein [bacterium]